jgi:hypothetical protein
MPKKILVTLILLLNACGGGSGSGSESNPNNFAGVWLLNLESQNTAESGGNCPEAPITSGKVTINQSGTTKGSQVIAELENGDSLSGDIRFDGNFVTGKVIRKISCGSQIADVVYSFGFDKNDGESAEAFQNYIIPCGSSRCRTLYKGQAIKQ